MKDNEDLIDTMADGLANMDDWDTVKDLKTSFMEFIIMNHPKADKNMILNVFQAFEAAPLADKFRGDFNHSKFVKDQIEKYESKS
jgi:hypothetical protein